MNKLKQDDTAKAFISLINADGEVEIFEKNLSAFSDLQNGKYHYYFFITSRDAIGKWVAVQFYIQNEFTCMIPFPGFQNVFKNDKRIKTEYETSRLSFYYDPKELTIEWRNE